MLIGQLFPLAGELASQPAQGFPCHAEIGGNVDDGSKLEDIGVLVDQCLVTFLWGLGSEE